MFYDIKSRFFYLENIILEKYKNWLIAIYEPLYWIWNQLIF